MYRYCHLQYVCLPSFQPFVQAFVLWPFISWWETISNSYPCLKTTVENYSHSDQSHTTLNLSQALFGAVCWQAPVTSQNEKTSLLGKTKQDYASIVRWMSFANQEILEPMAKWFRPLVGRDPYNKKNVEDAQKVALKAVGVLEQYLLVNTFLVGERITTSRPVRGWYLLPRLPICFWQRMALAVSKCNSLVRDCLSSAHLFGCSWRAQVYRWGRQVPASQERTSA